MAFIRIILLTSGRATRDACNPRHVGFSCAWLPRLSIAPDAACDHWTFGGRLAGDGRQASGDCRELGTVALSRQSPALRTKRIPLRQHGLETSVMTVDVAVKRHRPIGMHHSRRVEDEHRQWASQ